MKIRLRKEIKDKGDVFNFFQSLYAKRPIESHILFGKRNRYGRS
jgi:hypothetical protein